MELVLVRNLRTELKNDKNGIEGRLIVGGKKTIAFKTLENLLYLAPEGKYIMRKEFSPKFNTKLWELYGINKRTEIKIHHGTHSQHSKGCILLGDSHLDCLHDTLRCGETYIINIVNI